jgi:hypothetical protein
MLYCSSIIAQLIWRSSHSVISNKVHVPDSAWPATPSISGDSRGLDVVSTGYAKI